MLHDRGVITITDRAVVNYSELANRAFLPPKARAYWARKADEARGRTALRATITPDSGDGSMTMETH